MIYKDLIKNIKKKDTELDVANITVQDWVEKKILESDDSYESLNYWSNLKKKIKIRTGNYSFMVVACARKTKQNSH